MKAFDAVAPLLFSVTVPVPSGVPEGRIAPTSVEDNQIVAVSLPFSSFLLDSSVAEYLSLSESQAEAIQQVILGERRALEPLIAQLGTTREKLLAADAGRTSQKDIKALADKEAGLLAKLIVANARMQSKIYKLLTPEQQLKLDEFKRSSESAGIVSRKTESCAELRREIHALGNCGWFGS